MEASNHVLTDNVILVNDLLIIKRDLLRGLKDVDCAILSAGLNSTRENLNADQIKQRIKVLRNEFHARNVRLHCQEKLLRCCQVSTSLKHTFSRRQESDDASTTSAFSKVNKDHIKERLEGLNAIGTEIMKSFSEVAKMETKLSEHRRQSLTLIQKARSLYEQLSSLDKNVEDENNQELEHLQRTVDKGEGIVRILRTVFMGLIHGSAVDWFEDEELKNVLLSE